jgi:hypothetical protein
MQKAYKMLEKTKGETRRWEDNIKTYLKEIWEIVNWTHLVQESHWYAL